MSHRDTHGERRCRRGDARGVRSPPPRRQGGRGAADPNELDRLRAEVAVKERAARDARSAEEVATQKLEQARRYLDAERTHRVQAERELETARRGSRPGNVALRRRQRQRQHQRRGPRRLPTASATSAAAALAAGRAETKEAARERGRCPRSRQGGRQDPRLLARRRRRPRRRDEPRRCGCFAAAARRRSYGRLQALFPELGARLGRRIALRVRGFPEVRRDRSIGLRQRRLGEGQGARDPIGRAPGRPPLGGRRLGGVGPQRR